MGLDRLTAAALVLLAAGCGRSHLPQRLIDGQRAQQFSPVHGSVIAMSRVLRGTMLGTRFSLCRPAALAGDPLVVERIGVDQGSYTEIYESLAGLPVRVASTKNVQLDRSRAAFGITQYDVHGRELVRGVLEAAVAG